MRPANSRISSFILDHVRWQFLLPLTFLIMLTNISLGGAQSISAKHINIEEGGKLWIEGSASMVNYKCNAEKLSGNGEITNADHPEATIQGNNGVSITVILPVKTLDCGKRAMNKDMYEALKSESFPEIRYHLLNAQLTNSIDGEISSEWMNIRARGIMEIAGVKDTTSFNVKGKIIAPNRFKVQGSKNIHMDTYNIKPPSAMFGLIKADKNLVVHFDVTVRIDDDVQEKFSKQ